MINTKCILSDVLSKLCDLFEVMLGSLHRRLSSMAEECEGNWLPLIRVLVRYHSEELVSKLLHACAYAIPAHY
jgi:hypothetical protein